VRLSLCSLFFFTPSSPGIFTPPTRSPPRPKQYFYPVGSKQKTKTDEEDEEDSKIIFLDPGAKRAARTNNNNNNNITTTSSTAAAAKKAKKVKTGQKQPAECEDKQSKKCKKKIGSEKSPCCLFKDHHVKLGYIILI
jgi:hypothetical protein